MTYGFQINSQGVTNMMQAGKYYIGDLCYVMHDKWDEFCDLTIKGHECLDGVFTMQDGTVFSTYGTKYGDGTYQDQNGNSYPVDAGLIGCILVDSISPEERDNLPYGNVHDFSLPFHTSSDDAGNISFGEVVIPTGDQYDDDDES
jgi:hypothetical protein